MIRPSNDRAPAASTPTAFMPILKQTVSEWSEDKAIKLSAALAFYTILSLGPLLIITLKITTKMAAMIYGPEGAGRLAQQQVDQLIGPAGAQAVNDMIVNGSKSGSGVVATIISVVILLFSASGVFGELQDSLNTIWEVKPKPGISWWQTIYNRVFNVAMVFVIAFLLLVSLFVSTLLTTLTHAALGDAKWVGIPTDIVASLVVVTLLIGALFKFLPDVKIQWRDVLVGAFITAVLFKLGQYGLALYFKFSSTTSVYGAAGSLVAILLWVYYSGWILFFGAEFTQVWAKSHGRGLEPAENAEAMPESDRAEQGIPHDHATTAETQQA
ncbi:MAG TPA: YihY/virulence factor BrkB family protein [Tepidisphaeraceae bacterium]|jgi:membrane protein